MDARSYAARFAVTGPPAPLATHCLRRARQGPRCGAGRGAEGSLHAPRNRARNRQARGRSHAEGPPAHRQKEWTTGDAHDVTDRSFTVRRALRLNDALPGDAVPRWSWQPGPWLLVDRTTGHISALHLPDFDAEVSDAVWFRDYAAYCGTADTAKGGLFAIVAQLGARRAVVQKQIGKWPQTAPATPVCKPAVWQREPMRVTLQPTGGDAMTFDVVGAASLIEENDSADDAP
jgi:hypothetical protein